MLKIPESLKYSFSARQKTLHYNAKQKELTRLHNHSPMNTETRQPVQNITLKDREIKIIIVVT